MLFADEGMESRYQALHSFLLGIRGTIAPFCGAGLVTLLKLKGVDIRYVFLLAVGLLVAGVIMQALCVKRVD